MGKNPKNVKINFLLTVFLRLWKFENFKFVYAESEFIFLVAKNQFSFLGAILYFLLVIFANSWAFFNFLGFNELTIGHDIIFTFAIFCEIIFVDAWIVCPKRNLDQSCKIKFLGLNDDRPLSRRESIFQ